MKWLKYQSWIKIFLNVNGSEILEFDFQSPIKHPWGFIHKKRTKSHGF